MWRCSRARVVFGGVGIASAVVGIGLWWWPEAGLRLAGAALAVSDAPGRADVILVLGGDFYGPRMVEAAGLVRRGVAPRLLISGPPYHQQFESDLAIEFLQKRGMGREQLLGYRHRAGNTMEEAFVMREPLDRIGAGDVVLVTSNYHALRALWLFRCAQPGRRFWVVAAADPHFSPGDWWHRPAEWEIVKREYASLLWSLGVRQWRYRLAGVATATVAQPL